MCVDDINLPESQIWLFLFSAQSPSVILIASQREFLLFSWHSKVSNVITKYLSVHSPYINHSMSLLYTLYAPDCPPHPLFLLKHTSCFYSRYFFQTWWASLLHLYYFILYTLHSNRYHVKENLSLNAYLLLKSQRPFTVCDLSLSDTLMCMYKNRDNSQNNLMTWKA